MKCYTVYEQKNKLMLGTDIAHFAISSKELLCNIIYSLSLHPLPDSLTESRAKEKNVTNELRTLKLGAVVE